MFGNVRRTLRSNIELFRTSVFGPKPNFERLEHPKKAEHRTSNSVRPSTSTYVQIRSPIKLWFRATSIPSVVCPMHRRSSYICTYEVLRMLVFSLQPPLPFRLAIRRSSTAATKTSATFATSLWFPAMC